MSKRFAAASQFRVSLSPLVSADDPYGTPLGCLARSTLGEEHADTVEYELEVLCWTTLAAAALHPEDFVAVSATPDVTMARGFERAVAELACDRLMLVFERARVGQRQAALDEAVAAARRHGIRVGVRGNRVASSEGFDAVLVSPNSSALGTQANDSVLVIATELRTAADIGWAREYGADLWEGPALVAPTTVAPVDLRRLRRA